ncbi:MAG TPA: OB-fold domain-containing protein [Steroidobacteraceae bacterium]|jgi:hypothetical protein
MSELVHPEQDFAAFLETGRFMLQRSRETGQFIFYARVAEPGTGCTDLEWVEASGAGTVYSTTVIRQKPPAPSYNLALVDLAEGPRMMTRIDGVPPQDVRIGMRVSAKIILENSVPLLVFEPT